MICPKCKEDFENNKLKFCPNCGENLKRTQNSSSQNKNSISNSQNGEIKQNKIIESYNPFLFLFQSIIKPIVTIKKEINNYKDMKTAAILIGVLVIIAMVSNVIQTILRAIVIKKCTFFTNECTTRLNWKGLDTINFTETIFIPVIIVGTVIALLALIYFLGSRILKKNEEYPKLLVISSIGLTPIILGISVIAPLCALIYKPLSFMIISFISFYSFNIIIHSINEQMQNKITDKTVYFHAISLGIFIAIVVLVLTQIILGQIANPIIS